MIRDVRARGVVNTYRVLNATLHGGSKHYMIARRYDPEVGRFLPARMVGVHKEHSQSAVAKCRRRVRVG